MNNDITITVPANAAALINLALNNHWGVLYFDKDIDAAKKAEALAKLEAVMDQLRPAK